ncbi:MAG TPA: thiol-disulfide oxidoreductase [Rhizobiales bacterium]|nr:thiol-disulfide oxidoreductase [Hyphomicrobiales bacterium]
MTSKPGITMIFDSDCILCSHWVRLILSHETSPTIHFASSHKTVGQQLASDFGYAPEDLDLTYLVICNGEAFAKSDATFVLLGELKAPWSWLRILRIIPRPVRDAFYDLIARNRLQWFGRKTDCLIPTPEQRTRFLD